MTGYQQNGNRGRKSSPHAATPQPLTTKHQTAGTKGARRGAREMRGRPWKQWRDARQAGRAPAAAQTRLDREAGKKPRAARPFAGGARGRGGLILKGAACSPGGAAATTAVRQPRGCTQPPGSPAATHSPRADRSSRRAAARTKHQHRERQPAPRALRRPLGAWPLPLATGPLGDP